VAQNEQTPNSSLPARPEILNRWIAALSERKIDPLHDEIMDFASLFESDLAQSFVDRFGGTSLNGRHLALADGRRASWARRRQSAWFSGAWPF